MTATVKAPRFVEAIRTDRFSLKIGGYSGQGINSIGEVLVKLCKETGWQVFGYREYPSLIIGGYASYQMDISDHPVNSSSERVDVLVCLGREALKQYITDVRPGGLIIHTLPRFVASAEQKTYLETNNIEMVYVPAEDMVRAAGAHPILINTLVTALLARLLGFELELVKRLFREKFSYKQHLLEANIAFLDTGYNHELISTNIKPLGFARDVALDNYISMTGNHAFVLGAVAAGVRALYAYPMTPSSSILSYAAAIYHETGMLVRQVEDEISVAQMGLGSMHMGTRALVATSGGGFDLMSESLSMAGITEIPFVCIIAQRPGPATGLPTWTAAGDLNLALYAGHGEYPRCVLSGSDPISCYEQIQVAFNLAEELQIPVLVLTDKQIAESMYTFEKFPAPLPIVRGLASAEELEAIQSTDRYADTPSGISKRWLPGQSDATFDANADEHTADGSITEEAEQSRLIMEKRMRKLVALRERLPEPELFGPADADVLLVGWGSTKTTVVDALTIMEKQTTSPLVAYLHYTALYPLRTERLLELVGVSKRVVLVEQNYLGQLGQLITQETGYQFAEKLLKYDGRPLFVEDILALFETPAHNEKGAA
jgi:2-oxoglutarate ferredoxin oxidoreductase subunit alpha